jgi:hypothetical protein
MRRLIMSTFVTLDGGWSVNYCDDRMAEVKGAAMSVPFA